MPITRARYRPKSVKMQLPTQYLVFGSAEQVSSDIIVFSLLKGSFDWPEQFKAGTRELHFRTQMSMDPEESSFFGGKAAYQVQ